MDKNNSTYQEILDTLMDIENDISIVHSREQEITVCKNEIEKKDLSQLITQANQLIELLMSSQSSSQSSQPSQPSQPSLPSSSSTSPSLIKSITKRWSSPPSFLNNKQITVLLFLSTGQLCIGTEHGLISIFKIDYSSHQFVNLFERDLSLDLDEGAFCKINSLCEISNSRIISASADCQVRIFKLENNKLIMLRKLSEHNDNVLDIVDMGNECIASCGDDGIINIWSTNKHYKKVKEIKAPKKYIYSLCKLKKKEELIVSCKDVAKGELVFYEVDSFNKVKNIEGVFTENPRGLVEVKENVIVVASPNNEIVVIDVNKYEVLKRINEGVNTGTYYFSFGVVGKNLLFASQKKLLRINVEKWEEYKVIKDNDKEFIGNVLAVYNNLIFVDNWEKDINVYSYEF